MLSHDHIPIVDFSELHMISVLMLSVITRFGNVIPEGRVKLILCLHDLGKESGFTFFIKRGIPTESAMTAQALITFSEDTFHRKVQVLRVGVIDSH